MKKTDNSTVPVLRHFYRPHLRSSTWYTGQVVNNITGEVTTPPSRTKQSFVGECDINNIIKHFKLTGQIRHINAKASQGAFTDLPPQQDFQEALNTVLAAEDSFASLPAHVRARFQNDPAQFLGFVGDPANQDEMIKLGLAKDNRPPAPSAPPPPPAPPKEGGN